VRRLLVEEGADIKKELYVGMVVDRGTQKVVLMASSEGGMDIEEVAAKAPQKIHKVFIDPVQGLSDADADEVALAIGIPQASVAQGRAIFKGLYKCFDETDASLAEINPLILTGDGRVVALDAKLNFDDNALFRHPDLVAMRDLDEEDPFEIEASKYELNYISLDGNIACMVNGAGLAMATMDTIKLFGGSPANFLDVGGSATAERVTAAFKIMLSNKKVKAILVNIFGGIMKCDTIAAGVVAAAREVKLSVPLVVRMKGTNEDLGKKILKDSGLPIISADNMADAAKKVVGAIQKKKPKAREESTGKKPRRRRRRKMSILIDKNTRVMTQGITGKTGMFHTQTSRAYANGKACFVAGVNPKKAGENFEGIPIFGSVKDAKAQTGANVSVIYVPPPFAASAIDEAVDADLDLVICITEGIPVRDMIRTKHRMKGKRTLLVGPNCPGVITPDQIKIGIMPGHIHKRGQIGVVSRSGTLTYEAVGQLTELGLGQSSCVGIGGDPVNGLKHIDVMKMFNDDPQTEAVIMVGEIGGSDEETAAQWVKKHMKKPVVGFIAGITAPPGKRMGHAGAIISGGKGTAQEKLAVMEECGIKVTRNPAEMGKTLKSVLKK
jgi:succinyl-CoA synthetase alpha subunit